MRIRRDVLAPTPVFFEQLFRNLLGTVEHHRWPPARARCGVGHRHEADSINLIVSSLFSALAIGATVVVAQCIGRGERARRRCREPGAGGLRPARRLLGALELLLREPLLAWLYAARPVPRCRLHARVSADHRAELSAHRIDPDHSGALRGAAFEDGKLQRQ